MCKCYQKIAIIEDELKNSETCEGLTGELSELTAENSRLAKTKTCLVKEFAVLKEDHGQVNIEKNTYNQRKGELEQVIELVKAKCKVELNL